MGRLVSRPGAGLPADHLAALREAGFTEAQIRRVTTYICEAIAQSPVGHPASLAAVDALGALKGADCGR